MLGKPKVLVVLGDKLTPSRVVEMAIHGHNLPHEFPQEALDECNKLAKAAAMPGATDDQIDETMSENLCRCGTYPKIEEAITTWQD